MSNALLYNDITKTIKTTKKHPKTIKPKTSTKSNTSSKKQKHQLSIKKNINNYEKKSFLQPPGLPDLANLIAKIQLHQSKLLNYT